MKSRMDKYNSKEQKRYERTRKNTKLYESVYEDIYKDMTYKNMEIIDSAKEININKLKNILDNKYDIRQYRTLKDYSIEDTTEFEKPFDFPDENKSHDINEILNEAKSKRAFIEEAREKQKYIDFKEQRKKDKYESLEKEEKELEDLINTMVVEKQKTEDSSDELDLLSDLKGNENTIVTTPIEATFNNVPEENTTANLEKTLARADKNFYTDSNMFTKNDFEDFSTLTKSLMPQKRGKKIILIILIILVLLAIGFLVYTKFIAK